MIMLKKDYGQISYIMWTVKWYHLQDVWSGNIIVFIPNWLTLLQFNIISEKCLYRFYYGILWSWQLVGLMFVNELGECALGCQSYDFKNPISWKLFQKKKSVTANISVGNLLLSSDSCIWTAIISNSVLSQVVCSKNYTKEDTEENLSCVRYRE